jgi:hypothetical protein
MKTKNMMTVKQRHAKALRAANYALRYKAATKKYREAISTADRERFKASADKWFDKCASLLESIIDFAPDLSESTLTPPLKFPPIKY